MSAPKRNTIKLKLTAWNIDRFHPCSISVQGFLEANPFFGRLSRVSTFGLIGGGVLDVIAELVEPRVIRVEAITLP